MNKHITDPLLSEEQYYSRESDKKYMSPTLYKGLCRCSERTMAFLRGEYEFQSSPSLVIGQVVEAMLLDEDPASVIAQHPEMFSVKLVEHAGTIPMVGGQYPELVTRNGTWKSGALTKARELMPEAFQQETKLKSDFEIIDQVVERVRRDAVAMEYLQGEHQVVLTGSIGGVPWKGKVDTINFEKHRIVDLKIMRDFQRRGGVSFIEAYQYDLQLAIYQELARQQFGGDWEIYIMAASKETPSDLVLADIPNWRSDELLNNVEMRMPGIARIWRGEEAPTPCGRCDFCRDHKTLAGPINFDLVGMSREELAAIGVM